MDDTIANAIIPVDKMQKTFGELATCFSAILDNLRNVESDSSRVQHRRGGEGVEAGGYLRQGLHETGLARDAAKEAPPIPIEAQ